MRVSIFISVLALIGGLAAGQTTRPDAEVPASWERQVSSLAAAAAAHDGQTLQSLVAPDCRFRRFNAAADTDVSDFVDFATSGSVLGDHAYLYPPPMLAADIAHDVDSSPAVSEFDKKTLALDDQPGQTVAMQWLTQTLGAQDGTLVGIIVLWDTRSDADGPHRPLFVLVVAKQAADGFKLSQIVYGDPLQ
ncbi:MAG: hypothetical protein ABSC42_10925 [Tepidisphaeraceae bacterium]